MAFKNEVTFAIVGHIGIIRDANTQGWTKEVNLVAWNGKAPKIDIREWDEDHERMSRGITLTEEEAKRLVECLSARYEIEEGVQYGMLNE